MGQRGSGEVSYCRWDTVKPPCLAQGRQEGVERRARGKEASRGRRYSFLQHWQGSTWSSVCSVLPLQRESTGAPAMHTRCPMPWGRDGQAGAAFFKIKQKSK